MSNLNWIAGDKIRICAKVEDFCGAVSQLLFLYSGDIEKDPVSCNITCLRIGCAYSCLDTANRQVRFKSVLNNHAALNDVNCANLSSDKAYRELGAAYTDSKGIATLVYTVTDQDRLDYLDAVSLGGSYDIVCCIDDPAATGSHALVFKGITIQPAAPVPGATHRIEYDLSVLPTSFLDLVASNIVSLSDVLGDFLPMPENIQYISSSYGGGKFSLYVKYTEPVSLALPGMSLSAFAGLIAGVIIFVLISRITARLGPWGIAAAAIVAAAGAVLTGFTIYDLTTGLFTSGAAPVRTPKDDLVAVSEYFKTYVAPFCDKQYPGCAVDPPTCDSATMRVYLACKQQISLCQYAAAKAGTPTTECDPRVQEFTAIDDGLLSGTLTPADAKTRADANNTIINNYYTDTIKKVTCESGQVYDSKTQKCVAVEGCWISGPIPGTCILSAKTGTAIVIGGGLIIGTILVISLIKK